jgi:hypothetical protein
LPQRPQWAAAVPVSTSQPVVAVASQSPKPVSQRSAQTESAQAPVAWSPPAQRVPHAPQFVASVRTSTSQPVAGLASQSAKRVASVHRTAQRPASQRASPLAPVAQTFPQAPQLRASVIVSTQAPAQMAPPQGSAVQAMRPSTVAQAGVGAAHRVVQAPQRSGVVSEASHPFEASPSQSPKPGRHAKPHAPAVQVGIALAGVGQALSQRPQWATEVATRTHDPAQLVSPAAHESRHAPAEHTWPAGHARPQAEQLRTSERTSTSQPLGMRPSQSARPTLQLGTQRPAAHDESGFTT